MGIFETVIRYRTEEAREEGLEQGLELEANLKKFEYKLQSILKALQNQISAKAIATVLDVEQPIIEEIYKKINAAQEKKLFKELKKIRKQFSKDYTPKMLKTDLIKLLLVFKFTEETTAKLLECPLSLVKKIKKSVD